MRDLGRLITAMVSPFTDDGTAVDFARLPKLIKHLVQTGTETLLIGGTTGEGPTLSDEEFLALIRGAREHAPPNIRVMANAGTNNTLVSIARARAAQEAGADSLLIVCPYYNKPPQRGLIAHFSAIAESTDLPIMIYNIPGRTAVNMLPETTAFLAHEVPSIVGIKEASGSEDQIAQVIELTSDTDFKVWSGDDSFTATVMERGGYGVVSVISHVAGIQMRELISAASKGKHERAREVQIDLQPVVDAVFVTTNPIGVKAMLTAIGVEVGPVRLPLVPPSESERATLMAALETLPHVLMQ